jgi:tRNA(Ile)-lysidine synthase
MSLLQQFREYVHEHNLFHQKDRLLLAVSGGVDSVVLCELCRQAGFDVAIAHCNFQLRGKESERDEIFVKHLGEKYGVEILVKKFDTERYANVNKKGIQEAARDLRYEWFSELIGNRHPDSQREAIGKSTHDLPHGGGHDSQSDRNLKFILTAHHADDNIETVLMNFCRGTGLNGLNGIPNKTGHIRRPLLDFWKHELLDFAKENKLEFVEDSSNQSLKYSRNFFRSEVIPLLSRVYPEVKSNLRDNIDRFGAVSSLYTMLVADLKKKLCKTKNNEIHIPVKQLMSYKNTALIFEIISGYGFSEKQVDEVIKLAGSESGKFIQSPNTDRRIIKFRHWLIISSAKASESENILIEEGESNVQCLPAGQSGSMFNLQLSIVANCSLPTDNNVACLDAKEIKFPLILRRWKEGDYFYPLGMRKKKKLSRFFIDQKLSKTQREKTWVLEMDMKIIWVVGLRIDDRFKITEKTKHVLKISLETG